MNRSSNISETPYNCKRSGTINNFFGIFSSKPCRHFDSYIIDRNNSSCATQHQRPPSSSGRVHLEARMATTIRLASPAKLWRSYLAALDANPIRTKVATSTTLFVTGDIICQLGIERRQLGLEDRIRDAGVIKDVRNLYDVSVRSKAV